MYFCVMSEFFCLFACLFFIKTNQCKHKHKIYADVIIHFLRRRAGLMTWDWFTLKLLLKTHLTYISHAPLNFN